MKIVNATPHPIVVRREMGEDITFSPSGILPRVSVVEIPQQDIWIPNPGTDIPCVSQEMGDVEGPTSARSRHGLHRVGYGAKRQRQG